MASSPSPTAKAKAKIFTLPPELIDQILILATCHGFPSVVAHFSRTCRYFHQLVYRSTDNHLWRGVFLTIFDDPRVVLGRIKTAASFSLDPGNLKRKGNRNSFGAVEIAFDWQREFTHRIDAVRVMRRCTRLGEARISNESNSHHAENLSSLSQALQSLLSVLETAHPFPAQRSHDTAEPAPTFPPILTAHASTYLPDEFISYNAMWVNGVVSSDCPNFLVKRFLANGPQRRKTRREAQTVDHESMTWESSEEGQLFHKLIFLNGSLERLRGASSPGLAEAREVARSRVYNLRYLIPERCWGPFLPAGSNGKVKGVTGHVPDFEVELSRNILGLGDVLNETGQLVYPVAGGGEEEGQATQLPTPGEDVEEDGEYVPNDAEDTNSDDEGYDEDDIRLILTHGQQVDPKFVAPKPHQVVPDYAFLSAARLLVEMNLRDVLVLDNSVAEGSVQWNLEMNRIVDAFGWLQFVRMGGAPGFWENWTVPDGEDEETGVLSNAEEGTGDTGLAANLESVLPDGSGEHKGAGTGNSRGETKEYEGWDWAGAAGEWKRAVCWLDYRDLLLHNLTGFPSESLEETVRVFPMTLRVSGYSSPPKPEPESSNTKFKPASALESLIYTLPVIHLEGESRGSDVDSTVLRHIKGTVRMVADGAIRWTLTSSFPGDHAPEWVTDSIQVGAIGSVVGIIGMWTGAEHAATDPLGPTWAWKVG